MKFPFKTGPFQGTFVNFAGGGSDLVRAIEWQIWWENFFSSLDPGFAMRIPSTLPELKKETMQFQSPQPMCDQKSPPKKNETFIGLSPFPVIVTTRIVSCLVGDSYKPSFATITGKGDNPRHSLQILFKGHPLLSLHTEISTGMARDIRCMPSTIQSGRPGSMDHMGIHEWFFFCEANLTWWFSSWWLNPSENWIISPRIGVKRNIFETWNILKPPPPRFLVMKTHQKRGPSPPESAMFWPRNSCKGQKPQKAMRQPWNLGISTEISSSTNSRVSSQRRLVQGHNR